MEFDGIKIGNTVIFRSKRNLGFVDHTVPSHEHIRRKPDDRSVNIKKVKGFCVYDKEKICESITSLILQKT
jgi:hypothetical protein